MTKGFPVTHDDLSYAAFRSLMLSKCKSTSTQGTAAYRVADDVHPLHAQRVRIRKYREYVADHVARLLETSPSW